MTPHFSKTIIVTALCALMIATGCSKKNTPTPPVVQKPSVTTLSVQTGPFNTSVIITGSNFSSTISDDHVYFNGVEANITNATSTTLTVSVPKGAGTGAITVSVKGKTTTGPTFTYQLSAVVSTIGGQGNAALPQQLAFDGSGNVYFAAGANGSIQKLTSAGTITAFATGFAHPSGIAIDATGGGYLCDEGYNKVFKFSATGTVTDFAGSGTDTFADGVGAKASFNVPEGLVLDAAGNLYVADAANNRVRKITPDGTVSTFAGNGTSGADNGAGASASFRAPVAIAIDAVGTLYIADEFNHMIRKVAPDGTVSTLAGSGTTGKADGTGTAASFDHPRGITVDAAGNVYVADFNNGLIRKITPAGVVSTIAGNSTSDVIDGIGTAASFRGLFGVIADAAGNLYVSDGGGNSIRKITFQ